MSTVVAEPVSPLQPPGQNNDEVLYEIIDGKVVELPPMSAYATLVASILSTEIGMFVSSHPIGRVSVEMLFRLPLNGSRNRRADVAFVSYQRWPKERPMSLTDNAWDVVPDLAIEVTSPHDLADALMEKIGEYFQAGVQLVWVIYPPQRLAFVFESLTRVRGLTDADELDGGLVLPGFRLPLAKLFPAVASSGDPRGQDPGT
jgi:Uma2 family endonuclease